jgi:hypothetical protein
MCHFSLARIMVKVAYTVGRFQPPTIGHRMLIKAVQDAAGKDGEAYVFVSSTKGTGKEANRNPLSSAEKLPLLKHMFPTGVTFVDTAVCDPKCGGPGAAFGWLLKDHDASEITFVVGKERLGDPSSKEYFGPEAPLWGGEDKPKPGRFVPVGHTVERDMTKPSNDEENMSGTKARGYVQKDHSQKKDFYIALGYDPATPNPDVDTVYDRIYATKFGKTKGGAGSEEELIPTTGGPDGEPKVGGRRKTRRRVKRRRLTRSKASGRA